MAGMGKLGWLVLVLLFSAAMQLWFAGNKGLVLDEFHSHFHATQTSWAAFWNTLLHDNHPPLSFLLLGISSQLIGDGEIALRLPAMLFALLEVFLLWRLARVHGLANTTLAALLLVASSLHLDFATQARMYALHGTAVTGAVLCVTQILTGKTTRYSRVGLGVWLWIGVHNHYFFAQYSLGLVAGSLLAAALVPSARPRLRSLALPVGVAILLSCPWFLTGFATQWSHALPPGGDDVGLRALAESFVHLFFLNVRIGSEVPVIGHYLRVLFIGCGVMFTVLAGAGSLLGLSRKRNDGLRAACSVISSIAFLVPCATVVLATVLPRAGFTWHYIIPSAAAMAWLLALGWSYGPLLRIRRACTLFGLGAALLLCGLNTTGHGSEDYPAAVASLLQQYEAGDAIVSVEWQPALFPQGMPWDYYAPRLQANPPERLPMVPGGFSMLDRKQLNGVQRMLVLCSSLPRTQNLFRIVESRGLRERDSKGYGYGVRVMRFERE